VSSGLADHFKRQFQRFQQASTPRAAEKVLVRIEELPLSYRGHQYLTEKVKMVRKLLFLIEGAFSSDERVCRVSEWSAGVAFGEMFSDKILRGWTLGFIHNSGFFSNVAYKRRSGASVIHDSGARLEMTAWLNTASRAKPPAKAKDFMNYINASFNSNIKERTAMVWLHLLGFRYKCTLHRQPDFASQKSGLEEIYDRHNALHGTKHYCKFLPKFHPELNPIERVWSRMKWHIRKYSDGKLAELEKIMNEGLSECILPVALVRRYIRLVSAYYMAYSGGMDIVAAESWIRKHRSHRGFSHMMDSRLEQLYFPHGREESDGEEEHTAQFEEQAEDDLVLWAMAPEGGLRFEL
jgi:hypothetical protein